MRKPSTAPFSNELVEQKFCAYSVPVRERLLELRRLILATAQDIDGLGEIEETLRWGEPSYLVRGGSTIRVNQHRSDSGLVALYFVCQTSLVETFKELYGETFRYDGRRALVFGVDEELPAEALEHCISLALRYHRLKHLPLLGQ